MTGGHPFDVPDFLRIPQERRNKAWETLKTRCRKCHRPMKGTTAYDGACVCGGLIEAAPQINNGPGSTCRRAGIPDGINQDLAEYLEMKEARKKQDDQVRFMAMRAKEAAEKAEIASVKKAVQKVVKAHRSTKRRRKSF